MFRKISTILVPAAVLFAAWITVFQIPQLPPEQQGLVPLATYLLYVAGVFLACHFRRGRVFLALLAVGACYHLFRTQLAHGTDTPEAWLIYRALTVVVPFNILLVALMREKGFWTVAGRMRLLFVAMQIGAVWLTVRLDQHALWVALTRPIVHWPALERFAMPQLSLILILLAAGIAVRRAVSLGSPIEGGVFASCVTLFVLFRWMWSPHVPETFCAAAALILIMAVIQDSYNMAFRDDLTGLLSRRVLNEQLPGLGSRYAIAMVDVDHFKNFNDSYGHDVGDQVLKMVGARLMNMTGGGSPFRYGGEEFTVLFPGKSAKEALPHLERLRQTIADYRMTLRGEDRPKDEERGKSRRSNSRRAGEVSVTVSIGVAEAGGRQTAPQEVLKAADGALYKAKNRGRNQVCLGGGR
ncbi:GGDEF domain-containing protein [Geobacter sp. FeAm09]|uniref:GGDEF domain-containing protein n=1 Tax=Geobacter sp. FeAm09 TaxID=2597769 RepID=UPI0011EC63FB|nr:GGDEF domain-containing protein [Geobacter sp. FeAm09]QEM69285.1 GGDEF domain-containing protein [Geobacter sp. FeAm09]